MQFDWAEFQQSLKTAQFQRSDFNIRKDRGGIACEIGGGLRNVGSDHWMRVLRDGGSQAAVAVGGGTGRTTHSDKPRRCEGHREACRAWPDNTQTPRPIGGRRAAVGNLSGQQTTQKDRRPPAHQAARPAGQHTRRPQHPWGRNTTQQPVSPTRRVGITKPPGPTGAGRLSQYQ